MLDPLGCFAKCDLSISVSFVSRGEGLPCIKSSLEELDYDGCAVAMLHPSALLYSTMLCCVLICYGILCGVLQRYVFHQIFKKNRPPLEYLVSMALNGSCRGVNNAVCI